MIYLEDLREFDENMNSDEKLKVVLDYLKTMKDSYEAYLKGLEQRIEKLEKESEG